MPACDVPRRAKAQNEFAGTVADGEQVTETVDVMTAGELDLRDQFDQFDPSDDDEDENPDLGPMPEDIKADWRILPKVAMTARDSLKKHDMVDLCAGALPMGFTWSLYYCQTAMEHQVSQCETWKP